MKILLIISVMAFGLAACAANKPGSYETAFCADHGGVKQKASPTGIGGGYFPTECNDGTSTRFAYTGPKD